jgi:licheninase
MNAYDGVQFMAKGTLDGGTLVIKILHGQDGEEDNCDIGYPNTLTEWADYQAPLHTQLEEDWTLFRVPFDSFAQPSWGSISVPFEEVLDHAKSFIWQYEMAGGAVDFWIDNLTLYKSEEGTDDSVPDMTIQEPDPPDDQEIDDIEVDNPLQVLAMETLDRGYNITNWLEQDDFDNFKTYNEAFVEKLAENGFKALRLPIDLDRYIKNRDAYFEGEAELEIDPQLFTILDAFDEWTENHGLSLTIDYHQYDASMDLNDALDVDGAVALWAGVAEHFADNPREDLFFELMNEVEQAGNVSSVAAETWTDAAESLIAAIRTHDDNRVILFGDVQWYGITPLTERTPFADDRIIYVFHFYEPYIFTHQGASWATMAATHDIPYPYEADRWSEYYKDLGFDPSVQAGWLLNLVHNYYQQGNKSALRNQIIRAKQWAVENQVPVTCNEFGVYDVSSTLEDRVNYYTDLIDIFEELEIPWQHWFMIMDAETGEIDADLKTAFGLNS